MGGEATIEGPARRRTSWSLKAIVEDVAGRPIGELQDPARPVHPYLEGKIAKLPPRPAIAPADGDEYDPIDHVYPPLVGPTGRRYHGPDHEHHQETIDHHRLLTDAAGNPLRRPGPSHRPERLYLHYLLLHLDRLGDTGLRYLRAAIDEELNHRETPPPTPEPTALAAKAPEPEPSG